MKRNRRQFLQTSGALLASATALAGCLSGGSTTTEANGQGDETTGTRTPAGTDEPTASASTTPSSSTVSSTPSGGALPNADYAEWLPAPAALGQDHYEFQSVAIGAVLDYEDVLSSDITEQFEQSPQIPGIDSYGDVDAHHFVGGRVQVIQTAFEREATVAGFEDLGFEQGDPYQGYTMLSAGSRVAAIGDGVMLLGGTMGGDDSPRSIVEAVIDAKTGDGDRYVDVSDDVGALVSNLGGGHTIVGRGHAAGKTFEGAVAEGVATTLGDADSTVQAAVVFESDATNADVVSKWASDAEMFADASPDTTTEGRVVEASGAVPTGSLEEFPSTFPGEDGGSGRTDTPQVRFEFEYEETGDDVGLLTVTHYGGDTVDAENLYIRGTGFAAVDGADQTETGQWQGMTSDEGTVQAGHAMNVGVNSDYEISVVWEGDGNSATLAENIGPDA